MWKWWLKGTEINQQLKRDDFYPDSIRKAGEAFILLIRAIKRGCCAHTCLPSAEAGSPWAGCAGSHTQSHIMDDKKVPQWQQWLLVCSTVQVLFAHKRFFGTSTRGQNNPGSRLSRDTNSIKINMSSLQPFLPQLLRWWQVPKRSRSPLQPCGAPATSAEQTHTSVVTLVIDLGALPVPTGWALQESTQLHPLILSPWIAPWRCRLKNTSKNCV